MRAVPGLLLAVVLLSACGGGDGGGAAERTFRNPVHAENFPDPFLLRAGDTWYAYATNDEDGNLQTLTSHDLVTGRQGPDALPQLGAWAYPGKTWDRLVSVKRRYDPGNLFRLNQNIPPGG